MMDFIRRRWFAGLLLAALLARLPSLVMPYWYDEAWTQWVSALPFARMVQAVTGDVHPLGFFVLTWGVSQFAPWAMRLIPVLFSLWAIVAIRQIAEELHCPDGVQVVTVLLMALSPWSVFYGVEFRGYALLEFAVCATWLMVLRRRWLGVSAGFITILQAHNAGWVYCAIIGLYALWRERSWRPVLAGAGALAVYAPIAGATFISQVGAVGSGYWILRPSLADVLLTPYEFLFYGAEGALVIPAMAITIWLVLLIIVRRRPSPFMAVAAAAPALAILAISLVSRPVYLDRELTGCAPFFYILVGEELCGRRGRWRVVIFAAAAPLLAVLAISPIRQHLVERYQSDVVDSMLREAPAAPIWHLGLSTLVVMHQYRLPNPQYLQLSTISSIQNGYYSAQTMQALGIEQRYVDIQELTWVVVPTGEDPPGLVDAICSAHHCTERFAWKDREGFHGVKVYAVWP